MCRGPFRITAKGSEHTGLRSGVLRWDSRGQRMRLLGTHRRWMCTRPLSRLPSLARTGLLPPRTPGKRQPRRHSAERSSEANPSRSHAAPFHSETSKGAWGVTRRARRGPCTLPQAPPWASPRTRSQNHNQEICPILHQCHTCRFVRSHRDQTHMVAGPQGLPLAAPGVTPPSDLEVFGGGPGEALGCSVPTPTPRGSS